MDGACLACAHKPTEVSGDPHTSVVAVTLQVVKLIHIKAVPAIRHNII